ACMVYYFIGLPWNDPNNHLSHGELIRNGFVILLASILGILGSYGVAWFGIRINTVSNSRTAFSALKGNPLATLGIPLRSGMSADCTGDNAGDSVGPTADGFETYGVTGVALIAFLALALAANPVICATLIIWLFVMRALMIVTSLASYFVNEAISKAKFGGQKDFDFEAPLTHLVWITSAISIGVTFVASKLLLGDFKDANGITQASLWWVLSAIISCGTVAGALIPEFTKIFVSTSCKHVREVTNCSKHGGASLNILSGLVAGNFSAFWMGLIILALMFASYLLASFQGSPVLGLMPDTFKFAAPIFAFGLVAFGFLGMGPVTIAVDS